MDKNEVRKILVSQNYVYMTNIVYSTFCCMNPSWQIKSAQTNLNFNKNVKITKNVENGKYLLINVDKYL